MLSFAGSRPQVFVTENVAERAVQLYKSFKIAAAAEELDTFAVSAGRKLVALIQNFDAARDALLLEQDEDLLQWEQTPPQHRGPRPGLAELFDAINRTKPHVLISSKRDPHLMLDDDPTNNLALKRKIKPAKRRDGTTDKLASDGTHFIPHQE